VNLVGKLAVVAGVWLVCVLAAVTLQASSNAQERQRSVDRFDARVDADARFVNAYVNEVFDVEERLAPQLTADPASAQDLDRSTPLLGFVSAELLDRQGRVIAMAPASPALVGKDLTAAYPFLGTALGARVVSDVVPSVVSRDPIVAFATPLFGARYGVLSVGLDPAYSPLQFAVDREDAADTRSYVLDSKGVAVVLAGADAEASLHGLDWRAGRATAAVHGGRLVAASPVEGTPWTYVVDAPAAGVLAPLTSGNRSEWVLLAGLALLGLCGAVIATWATTSRGQARAERAEADERFRLTVEHAPVGMTMVGLDHRFVEPNARLCQMLGYSDTELKTMTFNDVTHPEDLDLDLSLLEQLLARETEHYELEKRYLRADGSLLWGRLTVSAVRDRDGQARYFVSQIEDVTEFRAVQEKLQYRALYDTLTGLANRGLLVDRLTHALLPSRRPNQIALGFCDLDHFKKVNDGHGHHSGDLVLKEVASRLLGVVRSGDTVARMGGDEFVLLLTDAGSVQQAQQVMERAREAVERPIDMDGATFRVGLSCGLALAEGGESAETLLRHSDSALYAAKHGGRGRCEVYSATFRHQTAIHRALEEELRSAIRGDELELHYQPIVDLASRRTVGYEALVRWQHPQHGLLLPGDFIELAEQSDRILDIGAVVVQQACAFLAEHPGADWQVFVNVSPRHLGRGLPGLVGQALAASGVPGRRLGIEVTENGVLHATGSSLAEMHQLRGLGVDIYMDDFGTGYSALSSLMTTPITGIKLDRSFTADLGTGAAATRIASTVADLADSLSLRGVVEGIETEEQAVLAAACGWRYGQGYHFARPAPADRLDLTGDPGLAAAGR
jgi:diguanylate cyclase (GGDEF)-like protein/PAS domain S-box-containing protein